MHTQKKLFTPIQIGPITLKHRVVMPPMSRLRAQWPSGIPSDLQLEYYRQRASDGVSLWRFRSIPINKIFALVSHAMLNGDAASERFDALDIRIGDRFAMVEKPVQPLERYIAVYLFENT